MSFLCGKDKQNIDNKVYWGLMPWDALLDGNNTTFFLF